MSATPVRRGRGRRPATEVRAGVLEAAGQLLLSEGLSAVTFERVANAAGSSKMTLYKWWPSPGALAAEAYFAGSAPTLEFPDTGDIEADLRSQVHAFVTFLTRTGAGGVVAQLIGAAQTDPALAESWSTHYSGPRRALALSALRRARTRGQIAEGVDLDAIIDQLWGACYHRLLVPDSPLDHPFVDRLVDNVMRGVAPASPPAPVAAVRAGISGINGLVSAARGRITRPRTD